MSNLRIPNKLDGKGRRGKSETSQRVAANLKTDTLQTKRPRSDDRGLLVKEGEGKESPILYARPPQLTIRQRSLPIIAAVLARWYAEGRACYNRRAIDG